MKRYVMSAHDFRDVSLIEFSDKLAEPNIGTTEELRKNSGEN